MSHAQSYLDASEQHRGTVDEAPTQPEGLRLEPSAVFEEPLSIVEVQDWLRVGSEVQAGTLLTLIQAVREEAEKITRRLLAKRSVTATWDLWYTNGDLPKPPIGSVSSVEKYDRGDDQWETIDSADYDVIGRRLELNDGLGGVPLRVTYTAGYDTLPAALKTQMLRDIRYLHDHRDPGMAGRVEDRSAYFKWRPY